MFRENRFTPNVPILLATSPIGRHAICADDPAETFFCDMTVAAMLSQMTVTGI